MKKKIYDVCIIGAGPAGLFAAIHASDTRKKVVVLEKNAAAGKKLLLTGLGQCNITNAKPVQDFLFHYGGKDRFVKPALLNFSNNALIQFFKNQGCHFKTQENGKIFPLSRKAQEIRDILVEECKKLHVVIKYRKKVGDLEKTDEGFEIKGDDFLVTAKTCVIATGGKSYPGTGATGDGYAFAKSLKHKIIAPRPALTSLIIENHILAKLSGISFSGIQVSIWRDNKKVHSCEGDFLITHFGVSGIVIIDNSRYILPGDQLQISFVHPSIAEKLEEKIIHADRSSGSVRLKKACSGLVPSRLLEIIFEMADISEETTLSSLKKENRKKLMELFTGFPMKVQELTGYHEAMITAGGISTEEINPKTMESRLVPGLYFAGEVIDIDGDTGGYNLQAAFSTGFLAGNSIRMKMKENDIEEKNILSTM